MLIHVQCPLELSPIALSYGILSIIDSDIFMHPYDDRTEVLAFGYALTKQGAFAHVIFRKCPLSRLDTYAVILHNFFVQQQLPLEPVAFPFRPWTLPCIQRLCMYVRLDHPSGSRPN